MEEEEIRATRVREFTPDVSIAAAVGRHHTFETAVADLVDNSIDARATRVLLRLLERDGAVVGLRIMDNGAGMDSERLDDAMTFGRKRKYGPGALGHFGLGLKAASLSQADILRVYSWQLGSMPAGRSIRSKSPTTVADLNDEHVESVLSNLATDFLLESGTVIEWAEPRTFLSSMDTGDRSRWLDERITSVISHLGIIFHRMISAGNLEITVDVFDLSFNESGPPRTVTAIDPFGYDPLPNDEYPADLEFALDSFEFNAKAHIWPAKQSGRAQYRLGGKPGSLAQGFYFYRFDRLLQVGGWNTLTVNKLELEYARIAVDITEELEKHVTINPEKAGLELDSDLKQALLEATIGHPNLTFGAYLEKASGVRRESRKYTKRPVALVKPSRGFGSDMLEAFESMVEFHSSKPIDIRWRVEFLETPLHVDLENRTIWLNEQYRSLIAGPGSMDAADAPFVKTLLVIVFSKYFEGALLGAREKSELGAWEELLTAALRDQIAREALNMGDDSNE